MRASRCDSHHACRSMPAHFPDALQILEKQPFPHSCGARGNSITCSGACRCLYTRVTCCVMSPAGDVGVLRHYGEPRPLRILPPDAKPLQWTWDEVMHTRTPMNTARQRPARRAAATSAALTGCLLTIVAAIAVAGPREQAKRIHDRLVGTPPSDAVLSQMESMMCERSGRRRDARDRQDHSPPQARSTTSRSRTSRRRGPIATRRCSHRSTITPRPSSAWCAMTCRSTRCCRPTFSTRGRASRPAIRRTATLTTRRWKIRTRTSEPS